MSLPVSFVELCGRKDLWGVDIKSGNIRRLDIRTSDIGGLRQPTFGTLATNTKGQEKSQLTSK